MSGNSEVSGNCLCGNTGLTTTGLSKKVGACHCNTCRKWGGGPLMAVDCGTQVSLKGEQHIGVFNSSEWAERGFCTQCGTHLFFRMKANNQYFVPVGLFSEEVSFIFDHQVFIEQRPNYYCFANKTYDMTGEELFSQHKGA